MAAYTCRSSCRFWRAFLPTTRSVHDFYSQCNNSISLRNYSSSCTGKSSLFCSRKWSNSFQISSQNSSMFLLTSRRRTGSFLNITACLLGPRRFFSSGYRHNQSGSGGLSSANRRSVIYMIAIAVGVLGLTYAAVPLYRIFCQATGYGGTVVKTEASEKVEKMEPDRDRELTIRFNADRSSSMRWNFKPQQREIKLVPGETALAFYTATNPTNEPIIGIATYNVIPYEAGLYFNKIQCFCFEEQRLNPREEVDMPVFFYIDPDFSEDPALAKVNTIILSYTFFEAKEGDEFVIPQPHTNRQ